MDILYICREGDNEELRYSLRSLSNLPHSRVIIAGSAPEWVNQERVLVVPTVQEPLTTTGGWEAKYRNGRRNLTAGLAEAGEDVVLMNDDIFVWSKLRRVPLLTWGPLDDFLASFGSNRNAAKSKYVQGEIDTCEWAGGNQWSYALHVPMPFKRTLMEETLQALPTLSPNGVPFHLRSAYGNMHTIGGTVVHQDVKLSGAFQRTTVLRMNGRVVRRPVLPPTDITPFVSTNDRSFLAAEVGRRVRQRFPKPSKYELRP